ncbi:MAG: DUF86 domain-containing protein [Deltaproteobacteria bacterium]|nr:DUF86 domain-containing protein [Deltaproteobacteria bacterium]
MRDEILYIEDCLEAISKILQYTKNLKEKDFCFNELVFDAVIRNFEIIGEAAKNIPTSLRDQYPDIPWKNIIAMRNIISHEYFGISKEIIWKTIILLPDLKKKIQKILNDFP